ncbi:MAG: dual specificity protein phosphatase family protein [Deltaproteobacteria bacterium]|nr:dual specificity protein phosphatase family protein [Deltaproteobacteria bacterium]
MKIAGRCLIAVGIIIGIAFYYFYAFDNFHAVVEERVYRSAQLSENKLQKIVVKKKIKTIINLRGKSEGKKWYAMEKKIAEDNNIQYYSFRFVAHSLPNCTQLDALIEALKTAPRPLLLHCKGGADRTGFASALALAIEKNSPLSELKQQFSLIYGVIPFTGSAGHLLFSQYENWLNHNGSGHNRDILLYWIKNFYVDSKGNTEFVIDLAAGIKFKKKENGEKRVATLRPLPKTISIHGWAFDRRRNTHITELSVVIPKIVSKKADLGIIRPDVAEVFNLKRKAFPDFKVGWVAVFDGSALPSGCHDIFLKVRIKGGELSYVATDCRLCI